MMLKCFSVGLVGVLVFYLLVFLLVSVCCFCEWQVTKKMLDDYVRQRWMRGLIMPRYVDADKVIDVMKVAYWDENIQSAKDDPCVIDAMIDWSIRQVKDAPTEDVAPVVHAHWKRKENYVIDGFEWGICSHCNNLVPAIPYCGFCGAKMDEKVVEE